MNDVLRAIVARYQSQDKQVIDPQRLRDYNGQWKGDWWNNPHLDLTLQSIPNPEFFNRGE